MISIVRYGPQWEEAHAAFAKRFWKKKRRFTPAYIYWKFRGNPGQELKSFILAVDGDKVIGQLGLVPCTLADGHERVAAQWACDLMVDVTYRGQGVAGKLYESAYGIAPVTLGSDPSPAASISMQRAGFKRMIGPWKFLIPIRLAGITNIKNIKIGVFGRIINFYLLLWVRLFSLFQSTRVRPVQVKEWMHRLQRYTPSVVHVHHDEEFALWRYRSFDEYYSGFELMKAGKDGLFNYCIANRAIVIGEWYCKTFSDFIAMVTECVAICLRKDVYAIRLLANTSGEKKWLRFLGAIKFRTRTNIIYYNTTEVEVKLHEHEHFYYSHVDSDEHI